MPGAVEDNEYVLPEHPSKKLSSREFAVNMVSGSGGLGLRTSATFVINYVESTLLLETTNRSRVLFQTPADRVIDARGCTIEGRPGFMIHSSAEDTVLEVWIDKEASRDLILKEILDFISY